MKLLQQFVVKRDVINNILTFIDEIRAAADNIQTRSVTVRTVKTIASPENIDMDWEAIIESCSDTKDWWKSDKSKSLKNVCHTFTNQPRSTRGSQPYRKTEKSVPNTEREHPLHRTRNSPSLNRAENLGTQQPPSQASVKSPEEIGIQTTSD